jgi:hypothetical protein
MCEARGMKLALAVILLAACSSSSPPPPGPTPPPPAPTPMPNPDPAPTPTPTPTPVPDAAAASADKCGDKPACVAPATCVSYFGIAGARGPQFHSCEIKCTPKGNDCPSGKKCTTIADGPGSVCR